MQKLVHWFRNQWVNMGSTDKFQLLQRVLCRACSAFQLGAVQSASEWAKRIISCTVSFWFLPPNSPKRKFQLLASTWSG